MVHNQKFCYDNCHFLNPSENEQDKMGGIKIPHFCILYKKCVKHEGFHPKLIKLEECTVTKWETSKEEKIDWKAELSKMSVDEFMKEYCYIFTEEEKINPDMSIELITGIDVAAPGTSDKSVISNYKKDNDGKFHITNFSL